MSTVSLSGCSLPPFQKNPAFCHCNLTWSPHWKAILLGLKQKQGARLPPTLTSQRPLLSWSGEDCSEKTDTEDPAGGSVFASRGCRQKWPQTWRLKRTHMYPLTVWRSDVQKSAFLSVSGLKSRCQQSHLLLEAAGRCHCFAFQSFGSEPALAGSWPFCTSLQPLPSPRLPTYLVVKCLLVSLLGGCWWPHWIYPHHPESSPYFRILM